MIFLEAHGFFHLGRVAPPSRPGGLPERYALANFVGLRDDVHTLVDARALVLKLLLITFGRTPPVSQEEFWTGPSAAAVCRVGAAAAA
jgi:hypothetical protein